LQLSATDYGNFLANESLPLSTAVIAEKVSTEGQLSHTSLVAGHMLTMIVWGRIQATQKLVAEFNYIRTNAVAPLSTFMDYITFVPLQLTSLQLPIHLLSCQIRSCSYSYMIDNVILLTLGTLHERDTHELLERCHPLGVFDTMPALCVATNVEELYNSVLVDTPLGQ
jgi:V-type H+-transporting ATPase subunit d